MGLSFVQVLVFILTFVPGYLFIHTIDYYLLKGEKTQFEKTVQILLASTIIWFLVIILPIMYPIEHGKRQLVDMLFNAIPNDNSMALITNDIILHRNTLLLIFITTCIYSFIAANIWGRLRKLGHVDLFIRRITGRDWYVSVALRFYTENLGNTILVKMRNNEEYAGVLGGAPDNKNDNYIILSDPYFKSQEGFEKLQASSILMPISETVRVEVINTQKRRRLRWLRKSKGTKVD